VIVVVAVGCGSGDDGSSSNDSSQASVTTDPAATKASFIRQGDAICDKTDKTQEAELKAYLKKDPNAQSTKAGQSKMVLAVGLPPIQREAEELAALGAPSADAKKVEAIVEGIEEAVEKGEKDPSSVLTGSKNPFAQVDKLAAEYGFKACNNAL
jgi:hypothetical protein